MRRAGGDAGSFGPLHLRTRGAAVKLDDGREDAERHPFLRRLFGTLPAGVDGQLIGI
jgi:hypothetical protein